MCYAISSKPQTDVKEDKKLRKLTIEKFINETQDLTEIVYIIASFHAASEKSGKN